MPSSLLSNAQPRRTYAALACGWVLAACSIRGAGPGDLVSPVEEKPPEEKLVLAPGSDGTRRLDDVRCATNPPGEPSRLLAVPAGDFFMGCNDAVDQECRFNERPAHTITLSAFSIDESEVTQGQYYACFAAGKCRAPTCNWQPCTRPKIPVGCVNQADARAYCAWVGKRLPTEAEWEKAARGTDKLKYPWGNEPLNCEYANVLGCVGDLTDVGSYPKGASPYGALDMGGNVVEIVEDAYDPAYYNVIPLVDPKGPPVNGKYVGKGGSYRSLREFQRASTRDDYDLNYFKAGLGFRCAK